MIIKWKQEILSKLEELEKEVDRDYWDNEYREKGWDKQIQDVCCVKKEIIEKVKNILNQYE